ncbi:MAG: plasmid pRiA4b ORF-3 family protein [Desulfomonilaceae bacterium]|nr:plasmid pRiA4b ORF-3 family protein [Desulfomonilaceae bacterium]
MANTKRERRRLVFQLKVTLRGIRPPIWRRIQVTGDTTLHQLHRILQTTMGWYGGHLHEFDVFGTPYGDPAMLEDGVVLDEKKVRLDRLVSEEKERFHYLYDFGDSWEHEILVEKIIPPEKGTTYPVCLTGKRACPPEDCGGPWGYEELLEALKDPSHEDHEEMQEWVDEDFDPNRFDAEEINRRLNPPVRKRNWTWGGNTPTA